MIHKLSLSIARQHLTLHLQYDFLKLIALRCYNPSLRFLVTIKAEADQIYRTWETGTLLPLNHPHPAGVTTDQAGMPVPRASRLQLTGTLVLRTTPGTMIPNQS